MEAAARPQADEYLASTTLESLLKLDGVIAGVEDEQRDAPSSPADRPSKASTCLAAAMLVSRSGWTREASTGAVQLSRAKPSRAMNW